MKFADIAQTATRGVIGLIPGRTNTQALKGAAFVITTRLEMVTPSLGSDITLIEVPFLHTSLRTKNTEDAKKDQTCDLPGAISLSRTRKDLKHSKISILNCVAATLHLKLAPLNMFL